MANDDKALVRPVDDHAHFFPQAYLDVLAEYGPTPKHWWATPMYARRVFKRRRELVRALQGRRAARYPRPRRSAGSSRYCSPCRRRVIISAAW